MRALTCAAPHPAQSIRNQNKAGERDDQRSQSCEDQEPGVEVLMVAPIHDVERPERIIDAPKIGAPRRDTRRCRRRRRRRDLPHRRTQSATPAAHRDTPASPSSPSCRSRTRGAPVMYACAICAAASALSGDATRQSLEIDQDRPALGEFGDGDSVASRDRAHTSRASALPATARARLASGAATSGAASMLRDAMLATHALDRKDREEQPRHEPEQDLHADESARAICASKDATACSFIPAPTKPSAQ